MKCPGQDSRYWKPGAIFEARCPKCGNDIEFFKDDTTRLCKKCGHRLVNPEMDFGCASYCQYAEQCVGSLPPELLAQKENLLKDRVAIEMKRYFKQDFKQIGRATRVARYAEKIGKKEGGNLAVVLTAAYLYDMGTKEAEVTQQRTGAGSSHGRAEGSSVARQILTKLGAREELVEEVCHIVARDRRPQPGDSVNDRVVYDADVIANLEEREKDTPKGSETLAGEIETLILTQAGKEVAREVLLTRS
jgi:HD domain